MLFNATQPEELRVAIVEGRKLIDIDIETSAKQQKKGNIYKAIITRVEPSLEACFVNYGDDKHGFLPFKEINRIYFTKEIDLRHDKIQDAIFEGQEMIVQVEKEERGNKGASLTTFISLAGRYLVLMPNNAKGGGISRRIEAEEREELREQMSQLTMPEGMSVIGRTAGIGRSAEELSWDLNYLLKLWEAIQSATTTHKAPLLIYLESSLVIRAIRDYFQPDIQEILIDTDDVYEQVHAFMSLVMPDNIGKIKRYQDEVPLFSRFQIENQIETAHARVVNLPSGGAIVIDHTEALVSIDVNSAKANRGADISETAFKTNLEAAEEVARQLRLRDIGGLIVIDFIDMEQFKHQRDVENRLRDALKPDRARVQTSRISKFGLLELSRQRLRPVLGEGSHVTCPRCNGTGHVRDVQASAIQVLRIIQEEALKDNILGVNCQVPVEVATFLLNEKRADILKIEQRNQIDLHIIPNKNLETPHYKLQHIYNEEQMQIASYKIAEEPKEYKEHRSYKDREHKEFKERDSREHKDSKEQKNRVQQDAIVKNIIHTEPAPIRKMGMFQQIVAWFKKYVNELFSSKELKETKNSKEIKENKSSKHKATIKDYAKNYTKHFKKEVINSEESNKNWKEKPNHHEKPDAKNFNLKQMRSQPQNHSIKQNESRDTIANDMRMCELSGSLMQKHNNKEQKTSSWLENYDANHILASIKANQQINLFDTDVAVKVMPKDLSPESTQAIVTDKQVNEPILTELEKRLASIQFLDRSNCNDFEGIQNSAQAPQVKLTIQALDLINPFVLTDNVRNKLHDHLVQKGFNWVETSIEAITNYARQVAQMPKIEKIAITRTMYTPYVKPNKPWQQVETKAPKPVSMGASIIEDCEFTNL